MNKILQTALIYVFTLLVLGCGNGKSEDNNNTSPSCPSVEQNRKLYKLMNDWYFWKEDIPKIFDFSKYSSMDDLLSTIRSPHDKWSFIFNKEQSDSFLASEEEGYGLALYLPFDQTSLIILYVVDGSPAHKAGLRRGDQIISVNGIGVDKGYINVMDKINNLPSISIKYKRGTQGLKSLTINKKTYIAHPILYSSVIEKNGLKIGYVVYRSFSEESINDFKKVFKYFKEKNINNMIFDLRYNGGGHLSIVEELGTMLNHTLSGKIAYRLMYNDKHQDSNEVGYFKDMPSNISLELQKVVFLTTGNTASASEVLINSIRPFVDVYLIGDTTHGKPVGMQKYEICDKYVYPIILRVSNADNKSFSFDGIKANCYVRDDLRYSFGNENELMLKAGIGYLQYNACDGTANRSFEDGVFLNKHEKIKSAIKK